MGFVKFDSTACQILRHINVVGPCRHRDIVEDLGLQPRLVGMTLSRLCEAGFIFELGKASIVETGDRSQMRYGLEKPRRKQSFKRLPPAERTARYRARKRVCVKSVFEWRGSV